MTVRDHGDPGDGRSTPPPLQPPVGSVRPSAADLVNRLHATLEEQIVISDESHCATAACTRVSASIGVVTVRADEQRGAVEILRDADLAMYEAKTTGQATSHFRESSPTAQN